ncbi:MAG: type II toxin-antitoxin system PemK/MazF family toxin [Planctomycetota bacterium]|nr:MAG: type II toxin-antitoxin system PemK/MazF family toxin [Planctomycetota bacterium]REK25115.1 MAG: type II toxin-antitoxin system PemK/MazF family toxin [Planctomycetota bacterium]REK44683.1 MAG: type II toxin-antitoxin system PemK/MazF family toxin [Planctomycetota bacterium]
MPDAARGEVWLVDLGMAAKVRPCLVVSVPFADEDRALVTLLPPTTATRGSRFEVAVPTRFLRSGAFDAQNVVTIPAGKLIRRLGRLEDKGFETVEGKLREWLGMA